MSPRYDVPKAAPEPLREVQQFVNSVDLEHELDWLPDWLDERGLGGELERARALREALRALVLANNGAAIDQPALELVNTERPRACRSSSEPTATCASARDVTRSTASSRSRSARCSTAAGRA